ncbi:MAG TPA: cellulase family glycosylhydrolase [Ktedonobacteraceae bacterium]|nr:cellulase family glycosylhydrolase [Ktedonobacteraceae bacterium]
MRERRFLSSRRFIFLLGTLFLVLILLVAALVVFLTRQHPTANQPPPSNTGGLAIHVSGNHLVNAQGQPIRLIGVNFIGAKWCVQQQPSIFVQPVDAGHVAAMASWHINVVRVTLNEDCWLGINNVAPSVSGSNYQNAIVNFLQLLHHNGLYAIVDLHWNAPGTEQSDAQQPMADKDHATAFWTSVATTFKDDPAVIFEPYNEPNIASYNSLTANPWECWRDGGCTVSRFVPCEHCAYVRTQWQTEGMQEMVNAIRATGATNPIMLGGLGSANDLSQFLRYLPSDPQHQLLASFHNYQGGAKACDMQACWDSVIAPIAQHMPVVTGEFGENNCQTTFVNTYMSWADAHAISYLPWVWMPWGCGAYGLIANWSGTPSRYGQVFYHHFHAINPQLALNRTQ